MRPVRLAAVLLTVAAGCGSPTPSPSPTAAQATPTLDAPLPPDFARVVIVVMENKEYSDIIGSPGAPYINRLARRSALATSFYGIRHPSLPNYLALIGGSTFGVTSNCTDCHFDQPTIVDQLEAGRISWKAYMEGMPQACFRGASAGRYAKKHNPFVYFDSITQDPLRCAKVVPMGQLSSDIEQHLLPRFVFITPDECNDMHDCSVRHGDDYLANLLPPLLDDLGPNGVLFLTFDEGRTSRGCCTNAEGGRIATIAAGPAAKPGRYDQPYTLYSILRTIEDAWRFPHLGEADCPCTSSMIAMLR